MYKIFSHLFCLSRKKKSIENIFITRRMSKIAWSLSVNTLTFYLLTVTDSIFIGHYDPHGLDILNTVMMPFVTLNQLVDYMYMGTVIPASHAFGQKDYVKARRYAEMGFFVYGIVGIIFWLFWTLFSRNIYSALTPDVNTQKIAIDYMSVVSYTYLIQGIGYKGIQGVFATTGFTKPFMISGLIQLFVNTIANRVLIYGDFFFPELGIAGAAWGTLFSSAVGALVMFIYLFKQKSLTPTLKGIFTLNKQYILTTIRMGFPIGVDMMLWGLGGIFLIWVINYTDPLLNRFMFFFITLPEFGFRIYSGYILAVTNLVGRAFGAGNWPKVFKIMKLGLMQTLLVSCSISLMYIFFPKSIALIFSSDLETINTLKAYIPVMCLIIIPRAIWEIFNATLHGLGITIWGIFVQIIGLLAIIIQAYVFIAKLKWGILGICSIYIIDELLRVFFMGGRLLYERKKHKFILK